MPKTARVKITQRTLDTLKAVEKETWLYDTEVMGLGVRMRPGAAPVWAIRYKLPATGQDRKATLWPVRSITLDDARKIARTKIGEIAQTGDVIDRRLEARLRETMIDFIKRVADDMEGKGKSDAYVRNFRQQCRDYVEPSVGTLLVRDVSQADVDRLLTKVRNKKATHNRVRAALSKLFNIARRESLRLDNPVFGAERTHEEPRTRVFDDDEVGRLLKALDDHPGMESDAFRLLFLTGSRPKELLGAKWADFYLPEDMTATAVWTKPSQIVKQRRAHMVELSPLASAVLRRRLDEERAKSREMSRPVPGAGDWVFPSRTRHNIHLTDTRDHWAKIAKAAALQDARRYDLRKSFATRILAANTDIKTAMSLTGHTQVAVFVKHYAQTIRGAQSKALGAVNWEPAAKPTPTREGAV